MSVTKRSIILAVVLTILSVLLYEFSDSLNKTEEKDISSIPTLIGNNAHTIYYKQDGRVDNVLNAEYVEYYDSEKRLDLKKAHLDHYDYGSDPQGQVWCLESDRAKIFTGKVAYFRGNVKIFPDFAESDLKLIETEKADYDFQSRLVTSDITVTAHGINWIDSGYDFTADLNKETITYKGQPNVTYYPQNN
ncbi:MAG: LPS export ABC transporter periplasmic protein LptC [Succinivibrio sp.]|nr:LPS export ABC transporter periplasmic protein LptC [Succinivibrio sp.]